ncbi:FadR/GntR family transcriptional regulator [Angustibacter sp. McL0619]|uniref:FadR/GntR family transcriptional regulator n=1 Tax=Angustibacter sp. McL0619 TaxID=3415676 RepID=UPI003CF7D209
MEPSAQRLPQAVLRPVRDGNAFEATVEQLATSVRLGVFSFGQQLPPERELAERLGVSRSTLREAIAALRDAGMVQTRRGRGGGTVVVYRGPDPASTPEALRGMDAGQIRDALDFRRVVEPGAAALAASRELSADQRQWLVASRVAVEQAADVAEHRLADSRLHLAIATVSGSDLTIAAVTQVQGLVHEMLTAIPVLATNIGHSNAQHRAVVDAVLAGDPAAARLAMEEHCDATSALLRGLLA